MLTQREMPSEDQVEIFRRADLLHQKQVERENSARAAALAAAELGIPQEYLDQAAAQIHAETVENLQSQKQRRRILTEIGIAAIPIVLALTLAAFQLAH